MLVEVTMRKTISMVFNILAKKEGESWIAHCLELDIVATAQSLETVKGEMKDLILAQVDYAFSNDNLENLYRPAPAEVWKAFYQCQSRNQVEDKINIKSIFQKERGLKSFVPPWIIAKTCIADGTCIA
jgi:hypothetical protein